MPWCTLLSPHNSDLGNTSEYKGCLLICGLSRWNHSRQCWNLLLVLFLPKCLLLYLVKIFSSHTCFCTYSWESLKSELWWCKSSYCHHSSVFHPIISGSSLSHCAGSSPRARSRELRWWRGNLIKNSSTMCVCICVCVSVSPLVTPANTTNIRQQE